MLADTNKRKEIMQALRSGKITSNCTPEKLHSILYDEEVYISEYELLVEVTGSEDYELKVKQGRSVIEDPEGDGYAVEAGKNIKVVVKYDDKVLDYAYTAESNKDLLFDLENDKVIER